MEKITAERLARAIDVCNFHPNRLVDLIMHNDIVPVVDHVETPTQAARQLAGARSYIRQLVD